ncbi:MAG: hypothetical protein GC185_12980 [Alphaproteobacteria bacterium]|nr:hypothetical protein [Alphaproteobacteria bacterium]
MSDSSSEAKRKSHESVLNRVFHSPVFVAATGVGVILLAFSFDAIKDRVSPMALAVGGGIFLFLAVMNMVVNAMINKLHNQEYFDQRLEVLNNIILSNNLNWLVNQKYVQMLEMGAEEVWAFAPELTYSIEPGTEIFEAVQTSLARGCRYKVFMPNNPETHRILADYRRLHKFAPGQVEFILVPHEEYVFHTIITIYNPQSDHPRAIEWLPVEALIAWLEMDQKHARRMVGIGEVLIKRYIRNASAEDGFVKEVPRAAGKAEVQVE